jgi:adenylylsulfate kinase-like enzyme
MASFPGVSAAYEPPADADLTLPTDEISVEESVSRIVKVLRDRAIIR